VSSWAGRLWSNSQSAPRLGATEFGGIAAHDAGSTGGDLAGSFRHSRILRAVVQVDLECRIGSSRGASFGSSACILGPDAGPVERRLGTPGIGTCRRFDRSHWRGHRPAPGDREGGSTRTWPSTS
jgi:hypothetical protein